MFHVQVFDSIRQHAQKVQIARYDQIRDVAMDEQIPQTEPQHVVRHEPRVAAPDVQELRTLPLRQLREERRVRRVRRGDPPLVVRQNLLQIMIRVDGRRAAARDGPARACPRAPQQPAERVHVALCFFVGSGQHLAAFLSFPRQLCHSTYGTGTYRRYGTVFTRPILSGYLTKINETRIVKLR